MTVPPQEYVPEAATGRSALLKLQDILSLRTEGCGEHGLEKPLLAQQDELIAFNPLTT